MPFSTAISLEQKTARSKQHKEFLSSQRIMGRNGRNIPLQFMRFQDIMSRLDLFITLHWHATMRGHETCCSDSFLRVTSPFLRTISGVAKSSE